MEEELNEHDLEERLYAMLHHVDETAGNIISHQNDELKILDNGPRSSVRRYWRTSEPSNPYQKTNTPREPVPPAAKQPDSNQTNQTSKPKEEKRDSPAPPPTVDLSIFQSPVPQNVKKTIQIIEHDLPNQVVLESSDEDEVIEVALPPKPTITIESSDEDELTIINPNSPSKPNKVSSDKKIPSSGERDVSASPVPSVVSSVSDEFIRGDCIALNISSRHQDNPSFDFSLHGSDLLLQNTPSKKKKKKKNKEAMTSTPIPTEAPAKPTNNDGCFATPKSKTRNKKQKTKLYAMAEKSIPSADIYDSDSNQSTDTNKNHNYKVTEKSLPSTDVYESDSNMSETQERLKQNQHHDIDSSDSSITADKPNEEPLTSSNKNNSTQIDDTFHTCSIVDLTESDKFITIDRVEDSDIQENIVMGNVSGFPENEEYGDENISESNISMFVSTKVPSILNEDLDFDNLKGKDKVCKRRRYSLTTLRAEMEKFYNESWGGENFNHREIQKSMSRDKSLWVIDPKDRMPSLAKKKVTCNYCNRPGHRDDVCRLKPPVCYMCGSTGHFEPRCPRKICINCGSPNQMYSTMCRNCSNWGGITCAECGQRGHPSSHCPDVWRRYHNTIDNNATLEKCNQMKKHYQLFCSGCTRRGHLIHTCRTTLPFSGLPINSPYVVIYRPVYPPDQEDQQQKLKTSQGLLQAPSQGLLPNPSRGLLPTPSQGLLPTPSQGLLPVPSQGLLPTPSQGLLPTPTVPNERNKRQSKSPTAHETHMIKKRNMSAGDESNFRPNMRTPVVTPQRKTSLSKDTDESKKDKNTNIDKTQSNSEKALHLISDRSTNHDIKGNMIQDNEVSDTSAVVTSASIFMANDVIDKLKTQDGASWLKETTEECNVNVQTANTKSFLYIKGKLNDLDAFRTKFKDWMKAIKENIVSKKAGESTQKDDERTFEKFSLSIISKNKNTVLRQLNSALESLEKDLGDPGALYKEFVYLQDKHQQLMKQKVINPQQLANNRNNINQMIKKLNMVLLGQAGLANGSEHLAKLYSFQQKLINSQNKNISMDVRKRIGVHYAIIFTSAERDDYLDLIRRYETKQPGLLNIPRRKKQSFNHKMNWVSKLATSIPAQPAQNGNLNDNLKVKEIATDNNSQKMAQKLAFYHKRLLNARPSGAARKKTRMDLVRKLHSYILSLFKNENMSAKTLKKVRKAQEQAQLFLANV